VWLSSSPRRSRAAVQLEFADAEDDLEFWGARRRDEKNLQIAHSSRVTERALYVACKNPGKEPVTMGHVTVYNGRPKWPQHFGQMVKDCPAGDIGVMFCGNPMVGRDLKENCRLHSSTEASRLFHLHKENF
jgi:hypothetical protein